MSGVTGQRSSHGLRLGLRHRRIPERGRQRLLPRTCGTAPAPDREGSRVIPLLRCRLPTSERIRLSGERVIAEWIAFSQPVTAPPPRFSFPVSLSTVDIQNRDQEVEKTSGCRVQDPAPGIRLRRRQ
jgi:hypothetical protein